MKNPEEYYKWLMKENATDYQSTFTNQEGQRVDFYEHPIEGDCYPIIAVCHDLKKAKDTDFFDLEDFEDQGEYVPVFSDNPNQEM